MTRKSGTTNYDNHHSVINNKVDISKFVQLLIKDDVFEEQLSQKYKVETLDLFILRIAKITTEILVYKYQIQTRNK